MSCHFLNKNKYKIPRFYFCLYLKRFLYDNQNMLIVICHDQCRQKKEANDRHLKSFIIDRRICYYLRDIKGHGFDIIIDKIRQIDIYIERSQIPSIYKHSLILLTKNSLLNVDYCLLHSYTNNK